MNLILLNYPRTLSLIFIFTFLRLISSDLSAQPIIQWDKTIGAGSTDNVADMQQTGDGGYILGGTSASSAAGDKSENSKGGNDYWIVKLSANRTKEWDKTVGGTGSDRLASIQQTSDGGYILGGTSDSPASSDKSVTSKGLDDYWIVKLDANGVKVWDRTFGGSNYDDLKVVRQTPDGGYILGGASQSNISEDKSENNLGYEGTVDFWVIKLSADGNIEWDNTIGTVGNDGLTCLSLASDGGYLMGGWQGYEQGSGKYLIKKIAANGVLLWEREVGNSIGYNEIREIQETTDGGFILGGFSLSHAGGDMTENASGGTWIVKLDGDRNIQWNQVVGVPLDIEGSGYNNQFMSLLQTSDEGYLLGITTSENVAGDKTEPSKGANDFWIVKLASNGSTLWDKTIGGRDNDNIARVRKSSDGGFILAGSSQSNAGFDKTENSKGLSDYWIVKLAPEESPLGNAIRINSGGAAFTASGNRAFSADIYYSGVDRTSSINTGDILNTTDDVLYRSGRSSTSFNYSIPVPNGPADVVLHFAETWFGAPGRGPAGAGKRMFNVDIEDLRKLTDFDIYAEAGGALRAIQRNFEVTITDGVLNINFLTGSADLPRISAIEVLPKSVVDRVVTLSPLADADVRDGTYATVNSGGSISLNVKNGAGNSILRNSYLKFSLIGISQVMSAKLRIYGKNVEGTSRVNLSAYGIEDDSWTESGITWNNAPSPSPTVVGSTAVNNIENYYEMDVTEYVKAQLTGDKTVSIVLKNRTAKNKKLVFNSKEFLRNGPQLVIETNSSARTALRTNLETPAPISNNEFQKTTVYPNPVQNVFTVQLSAAHSGNISLHLINIFGMAYRVNLPKNVRPGSKAEVDISDLSLNSGVYLLRAQSDALKEITKVLVAE